MNSSAKELMALKQELEKRKTEHARTEGEIIALRKKLKKEFGTDNIKVLKKKVLKYEKKIRILQMSLNDVLSTVRKSLTKGNK